MINNLQGKITTQVIRHYVCSVELSFPFLLFKRHVKKKQAHRHTFIKFLLCPVDYLLSISSVIVWFLVMSSWNPERRIIWKKNKEYHNGLPVSRSSFTRNPIHSVKRKKKQIFLKNKISKCLDWTYVKFLWYFLRICTSINNDVTWMSV